MRKFEQALALLAAIVSLGSPGGADAGIVSGSASGDVSLFAKVFPPLSDPVGIGAWDIDDIFWGFDEQVTTLAAPLEVFASRGGPATTLAAGTQVASHYVFFDPEDSQSFTGSVLFSQPILGVIWSREGLQDTDPGGSRPLGVAGVSYGSVGATGLEVGDAFGFSGNALALDWSASDPGDHIRVITAVPEPQSWALMLSGFALLGLAAGRRARRR